MPNRMRTWFVEISIIGLCFLSTAQMSAQTQPVFSIFAGTMVESTWEAVQAAAQQRAIVLLPVSVVEEHGPHLDLSPDIYLTSLKCQLMKPALEAQGIPVVIAPPMYWGINASTGAFPGSFTVSVDTFKAMLTDILTCLKTWGFSEVYCVNLHGDRTHCATLQQAVTAFRETQKIHCYTLDELPRAGVSVNSPVFSYRGYSPDYHAGAVETSLIYDFFPEKVDEATARKLAPQSTFTPKGYVGDPANFPKGIGRTYFEDEARYDAERIHVFHNAVTKQ